MVALAARANDLVSLRAVKRHPRRFHTVHLLVRPVNERLELRQQTAPEWRQLIGHRNRRSGINRALLKPDYIQHNPQVPAGAEELLNMIPLVKQAGVTVTTLGRSLTSGG